MDESYQVFHRVLSVIGISIFAQQNWDSKKWLLLQIINVIIGFLTVVFTSGYLLNNFSDVLLLCQGSCVWITGVIMFLQIVIFMVFRNSFRVFLEENVFEDAALKMPFIEYVVRLNSKQNKSAELKALVINSRKYLRNITSMVLKTYLFSSWSCITLYLSGPIYMMYITEDDSLRLFAFDMWFPWSLQNFFVYIGTFAFHTYCAYMCSPAYSGVHSTIFLLTGQIIRQLRILTFIFDNLAELALEIAKDTGTEWQVIYTEIFSQSVQHYVKTNRFANQLNVICQPFYLVFILTAVLSVCTSSVKIVVLDKFSLDSTKYYIHAISITIMVLMFCLFAQQVDNESEKLELAVTEKWYVFDARHRVNVKIFKMAVSRGIPIYAFGSVRLSSPIFTWFLRTLMSFFTLMTSFLEE